MPFSLGGDRVQPRTRGSLEYVARPELLRERNRITLLRAGAEAYPAMLVALQGAQRQVLFSSYILRDDRIGQAFQAAMIERARAGVDVKFVYDAIGSIALGARFVRELRESGVQLVEFRPIAPWRPRWGLNRRNHGKLLIVDGSVAFTGGLNIGNEYAAEPEGGGWYDLNARVDGELVADLEQTFWRTWSEAVGDPYAERDVTFGEPIPPEFDTLAYAVDNFGIRKRSRMHHAYLHAIKTARTTISIMNAYFIPDIGLRRQFRAAVERGVSVRVIVPSVSDVRVVYYASRYLYGRLIRRGVRIFEWPDRMMHAKAGVIDSVWATIGTYNLDQRSLLHNLECGIVAIGADFASVLQAEFDRNIARCTEIVPEQWRHRSRRERFLEWASYRLRYWL